MTYSVTGSLSLDSGTIIVCSIHLRIRVISVCASVLLRHLNMDSRGEACFVIDGVSGFQLLAPLKCKGVQSPFKLRVI